MKQIKLTQGKYALVDDADYEWLNQWKWHANKKRDTFYVIRNAIIGSKRTLIAMHREILGLTDPKIHADHKDGNGLNNQRNNLRSCTHAQNQMNRRSFKGGTSKFKGVTWHKRSSKWAGNIRVYGKIRYLGIFHTQLEAAIIYNIAARKYFGEFANPNKFTKKDKQKYHRDQRKSLPS